MLSEQWVRAVLSTPESRRHNVSFRKTVFPGGLSMFRAIIIKIFHFEFSHILTCTGILISGTAISKPVVKSINYLIFGFLMTSNVGAKTRS
jgi:hypothetical protein